MRKRPEQALADTARRLQIADRVGRASGTRLGPADVRLVEAAPAPPGSSRRDVLRASALAGLTLATLAAPGVTEAASCITPGDCSALLAGGGPNGGCGGLPCCGLPGESCKAKGAQGKPCGCAS